MAKHKHDRTAPAGLLQPTILLMLAGLLTIITVGAFSLL